MQKHKDNCNHMQSGEDADSKSILGTEENYAKGLGIMEKKATHIKLDSSIYMLIQF